MRKIVTTYQNQNLYSSVKSYYQQYLERYQVIINNALGCSSRILQIRVDLRFPQYADYTQYQDNNVVLTRFIKSLRAKLEAYVNRKKRAGIRVHPINLDYMWVRERNAGNQHWHYHLVIVVNGHEFLGLGDYQANDPDSLTHMVNTAWNSALGIVMPNNSGLVNYAGCSMVKRADNTTQQVALRAASYLCKVDTKEQFGNFHSIGSSQVKQR